MKDLIGVLDSGVGGISVLKKAAELLPSESFIYYGDNANAPYGPRPISEIRELSEKAIDHLLEHDVKAIVIACNTITSAYADIIRQTASIPIIGMEPAVKPASLVRKGGYILALATRATLRLEKFQKLMDAYGEGVIPLEGKNLVEIVESGRYGTGDARAALEEIFRPYVNDQIDGIVLGCTHYPFLRSEIGAIFPDAPIFDGRDGTVRQLKRRLEETNSLSSNACPGTVYFETSGDDSVLRLMHRLFEADII